ncbi:hypothetical protein KY289_037318 [Solanum tuberosum]|nr:hypothetical protein KY289_037318 [Solanum tuberosum]
MPATSSSPNSPAVSLNQGGVVQPSQLISFNPASQLSFKLTGSANYPTWKSQVTTLLFGYDLLTFVDGSLPIPTAHIMDKDNTQIPNPNLRLWQRQDSLVRNAIMASVDATIAPLIAHASTAKEAWDILQTTYASKSHSRIFSLRDTLANVKRDTRSISDYMREIKSIARSKSDDSLFIKWSPNSLIIVMIYVDDIVVTGSNNSQVYATIKLLGDRFSIKDLGPLHFFLGVEVIQHDHGLTLTQTSFIADILSKFNMLDANSVSTPLFTNEFLSLDDGSPSADATLYRQVIGSLQYLTFTRPDICFAVNKLAQFQHSPSTKHWQATKRLLRYLKGTITYGLHFKRGDSSQLLAYSDADWGGIPDTRHSTSAYVIFLGKNPISWCSNKQRTVARSSTEAEYRAVASVVAELNWLTNLLQELWVKLPCPPKVFCDNIGVTYLCRNPVFHSRMKHVAIDFHFVRDQVESGKISVHHIPTGAQLADALTKALPRRSFVHLVSNIGLKQIEPMLRGHDKDKDIES